MASIDRRDVVKMAAAALAAGLPVPQVHAQPKRPKKVIIAGGGIGGLCCAYELMKRGHEVKVLEAAGRPGGHVRTIHDPLADGLYADVGAEHFYKPGYDHYWRYVEEFNLPVVPYPRRDNMIRFISGKMYTEEELQHRNVLKKLEFNQPEIDHLAHHPWWDLPMLYFRPYVDRFENEHRPFDVGLNYLDQMTVTDLLKKDGASASRTRSPSFKANVSVMRWFPPLIRKSFRVSRGVPRSFLIAACQTACSAELEPPKNSIAAPAAQLRPSNTGRHTSLFRTASLARQKRWTPTTWSVVCPL